MYRIGIDVGSTYTKYCVMKDGFIEKTYSEKTPVRQKEYFEEKIKEIASLYPDVYVSSCGYGRNNVSGTKTHNELSALAKGCDFIVGKDCVVLDIGGQDTKLISQAEGQLKEFFVNDKCAAGSGMFLSATLNMLGISFCDLDLIDATETPDFLNSTCAVFAQSEIVEMIAENKNEKEIINAVIWQILLKAKSLLGKMVTDEIFLSGGLSGIKGITAFAQRALGVRVKSIDNGEYLSAIGCCVL